LLQVTVALLVVLGLYIAYLNQNIHQLINSLEEENQNIYRITKKLDEKEQYIRVIQTKNEDMRKEIDETKKYLI